MRRITCPMNKVVGVRFRKYGKVYSFDSGHFVLQEGDRVLAETEQGIALGVVCTKPRKCEHNLSNRPLKKISRLANRKDLDVFERNCAMEGDVFGFCAKKIKDRSLPMCLISVECLFDGSKVVVYFGAVMDRLDQIASLGADALAVEASMKGYVNDLGAIADRVGDRLALFGNVNPYDHLECASDEDLERIVREQAAAGQKAKGYIAATGSPITVGTSLERVRRFIDLAHSM